MNPARSHLYVPGDRGEMLEKAEGRGADVLIVDLEDAVAPAAKDAARETVAAWLTERGSAGDAAGRVPAVWVRVNPGAPLRDDLESVVLPGLAGICLAKAGSVEEIRQLDTALTGLERSRGIAPGTVEVSALIETAAAVLSAARIAAAPRVSRLQVGEADLGAELGVQLGTDEREFLWVRSQVVLASAAAGIAPPVGPVSTNFRDLDRLRDSTLALKRLGFHGRACIHPAQVAVVNEVFTPTAEETGHARELVEGYEAAIAAGNGVFTDRAGRMVDLAVIRAARRVLAAVG
ncbi:MAG: HpcH/HpaI aldolase/citrate lyase family protein [Solirubrobacteraceae bacterium]